MRTACLICAAWRSDLVGTALKQYAVHAGDAIAGAGKRRVAANDAHAAWSISQTEPHLLLGHESFTQSAHLHHRVEPRVCVDAVEQALGAVQ